MDYQIQSNSRRCHATGRELQPGDGYFSALLEIETKFVRQDYAPEAWSGPPPGAFSFWKGKVTEPTTSKRFTIDDDLLMDLFRKLVDPKEPSQIAFRFILALLLVRRKKLRLEDTDYDAGEGMLTVRSTRGKEIYHVQDPGLNEERITSIQEEIFNLIGWER
ncbi:MAG: hypothetical protein ACKO23_05800 [Gemmataceae bacterium]